METPTIPTDGFVNKPADKPVARRGARSSARPPDGDRRMTNGIANGMAPAGWPTESQTGWRPPDCQRNRKLDGTRRIGKRRHTAPSGACLTQPTGLPVGNRPISISRAPEGAACYTGRIVIVTYNPARGPFGGAMPPPHPIPRASPWADYSKRPRALSPTRLCRITRASRGRPTGLRTASN